MAEQGFKLMKNNGYSLKLLALLSIYLFSAWIGLTWFEPVGGFASLIWPPTGISLAFLLLFGRNLWPAVLVGAFFVNFWTGASLSVAVAIAAGNTLEAVFAVYFLERFNFKTSLEAVTDVVKLILTAAFASTLLSASIGTLSLLLSKTIETGNLFPTFQAWWMGNIISNLIFAPIILVWYSTRKKKILEKESREFFVWGIILLIISAVIFINSGPVSPNSTISYLAFPPLIWAAIRFSQRASITAVFVVFIFAIAGVYVDKVKGNGSLRDSIYSLELFIIVVSVTTLIMSSLVQELKRSEAQVRKLNVSLGKKIKEEQDLNRLLAKRAGSRKRNFSVVEKAAKLTKTNV